MTLYAVQIVRKKDDYVVRHMPGLGLRAAERVQGGAEINLNHEDYYVRIVRDPEPKEAKP